MSQGLSISDIVSVDVVMSPVAAALRNFGSLLILGSTPGVIDTTERLREYATISQVVADFPTTSPEYLAASIYFAQSPQPSTLYIGAFAQAATAGRLLGGVLSAAQQSLSNFTAVTTGVLDITIDGLADTVTAISFAGDANLNAVAATLTTALAGKAVVVWNASEQRFVMTSATTGATSSVSFSVAPGSGIDVGPLFAFQATGGGRVATGSAVETALVGVTACANASTDWYGLLVAPVTALVDADRLAIAGFIEAANPSRIYGITTSSSTVLDPSNTTDIASQLQSAKFTRTFIQYSTTQHAAASIFGRAFTVDFSGANTTITLKFKQEPGVTAETLNETQAGALNAKNCNVFVNYNNETAILQQGCMCNGYFFDEVHGLDWLQNAAQTNVFNALYNSPTKIPQTDAGINVLLATLDGTCEEGVNNGLIGPGEWDGPPLGALKTGQTLAKGYYNYAAPVASQSAADRQARKAPVLQSAIKLAGAVHFANVVINVNR